MGVMAEEPAPASTPLFDGDGAAPADSPSADVMRDTSTPNSINAHLQTSVKIALIMKISLLLAAVAAAAVGVANCARCVVATARIAPRTPPCLPRPAVGQRHVASGWLCRFWSVLASRSAATRATLR
jgi:hypothetical protein